MKMDVEPVLVSAAAAVGCEIDPTAFLDNVGMVEVLDLIKAAAGLHITTPEYQKGDVVLGPIFSDDADETARNHRPAIVAENDQIQASCMDRLREIKPVLIACGVFKER